MKTQVEKQTVLTRAGFPYFVVAVLVFILAGCINYEQKTQLNMDGSGTAQIHYWAEEDVVNFLSDGPLVFDETKAKERFSGEGITVQSVTSEMNEEDSTRHVHVELAFDNIAELAKTKAFEDVDITWEPSGDLMKFTQVIKSGESGGSMGMDEFTLTYTYQMPGEVVSSNATDQDGQQLSWKFKLSDLGGSGVTMSATVKKGSIFAEYTVTIVVVLGVILLLVILFLALRKKPAPTVVIDQVPTMTSAETGAVDGPESAETDTEGDDETPR